MEGNSPSVGDGGKIVNSNYQAMKSSPNFLGLSPDKETEREKEFHRLAKMNRSLSVGPG